MPSCLPLDFFYYSDRGIFARLVFGILSFQMSFVAAIVSLFYFVPEIRDFGHDNREFLWSTLGIFLFVYVSLSICPACRRRPPFNCLAILVFTIPESLLMGCITGIYQGPEVMVAFAVTGLVFVSLSLFTFQNKFDFTPIHTTVVITVAVILGFGITVAVHQKIEHFICTSLAVLFFCYYAIMNVEVMLRGVHMYEITMDDIVFAALNIYLDIVACPLYCLGYCCGFCAYELRAKLGFSSS